MIFRKVVALSFSIALISCSTGCDQSGQRVTQYPSGQTLRVDTTIQGGKKLTNSQWYTLDGQLAFETKWSRNGDGIDYSFYPNGTLQEKTTMQNNLRHGPTWNYDTNGNCTSIDQYVNGVKQPLNGTDVG